MRIGLSMSIGCSQSMQQTQRQSMSLEQRMALKLKQELNLKMSLEQVIMIVQKLWPQLSLEFGQRLEKYFTSILRSDSSLVRDLPAYLAKEPSAIQLQNRFPQVAPLFNMHYKSREDYGTLLRQGQVVSQGHTTRLELRHSMRISQSISFSDPWSLVDTYKKELDTGCKLPKKNIDQFRGLSLDTRLKLVDKENEVFRFSYVKRGKKFFKIPLMRNRNIDPSDIAIPTSKEEYKDANAIFEKAGGIQRIVRAVPYSEIRDKLMNHFESEDYNINDVVLVGIDRGGRLPTGIVRTALGKEKAYFLKVDQGGRKVDMKRLEDFVQKGVFRGKYVAFVDSTVDSGRQIDTLKDYFDDSEFKRKAAHIGWVVVGSNEDGKSLENHLNIDWGLDPDKSFEDDPELMGVDYGHSHFNVRACPTKMSTFIRNSLFEVPNGIVLDVSSVVKSKEKADTSYEAQRLVTESEVKSQRLETIPEVNQMPKLLIIGDGKNVTLSDNDARYLALSIEGRFNVMAGTLGGNPGHILNLVYTYKESKGTTLIQPAYMKRGKVNGFNVFYIGKDKEQFREGMISQADIVLALGGNEGTWTEIQKSLNRNKPTFVVRNFGRAGVNATNLEGATNLYIGNNLEGVVSAVRELSTSR